MYDKTSHILVVIEDAVLCDQVTRTLVDKEFLVHHAEVSDLARWVLGDTSIACVVMTDKEALPSENFQRCLLDELPENMPTLTLIKPSKDFPLIFDQVRRRPYSIHEYLIIPISLADLVDIVIKITSTPL